MNLDRASRRRKRSQRMGTLVVLVDGDRGEKEAQHGETTVDEGRGDKIREKV